MLPTAEAARRTAASERGVPLRLARALRAALALAGTFASVRLILVHRATAPPAIICLCWGVLVIGGMMGVGLLLNRILFREYPADWGLRAAWGFSGILVLSGPLLLTHSATAMVLIGVVGIGLALLLDDLQRDFKSRTLGWLQRMRDDPAFYLVFAVLLLLGLLLMVGSYGNVGEWAHVDDAPAYQVFPKQIAQTGTIFQPFALRRIISYGGESLFQAIVYAGSSINSLHVFDRGICAILVVVLVALHPRGTSALPRVVLLLPALVVLLLSNMRANLASVLSGAVPILAAYRTLAVVAIEPKLRASGWILLAVVVAGAVTLRPFYLVPAVGLVLVSQAFVLFDSPGAWRRILREGAWFLGALTVCLVPWAVLLVIDCATPLFPMIKGNLLSVSAFGSPRWVYFHLVQLWVGSTLTGAFASIHLVALAGVCIADRSPRRAMRALYIASFAGFLLLTAFLPRTPGNHIVRYRFPLEVAFVMGVVSFVLADARPLRPRTGAAIALVLVGLCLDYYELRSGANETYLKIVESLQPKMLKRDPPPNRDGANDEYTNLQATIPPGATLASMLDEPFRLDLARNRVLIFDIPGETAPKPGFPFQGGEQALASYLLGRSIRYLACMKDEQSKELYKISVWQAHMTTPWVDMPQHLDAPYVLDVLESSAKLVAARKHVFENASMVVIDLAE